MIDWQLLLPTVVIVALGLTTLGSISLTLFYSQIAFFIFGLILFIFLSRFHYQNHLYLTRIYAVALVVLLVLPFIFGAVTRGSVRWVQIGSLTIQPSEIIKPLLIIILASFLAQTQRLHSLLRLLVYALIIFIPTLLIFKQPDLGSTIVVIAVWMAILIASDFPFVYSFSTLIFGLALSPLVIKFLKPYQQLRLTSFLNPYSDPKTSGYHVIQSIIAVGSGGLWGRGLGHGIQSQLKFLPERQTDFIFASLAEELGLIGSLILLIAYFMLLKHLLNIARHAPDQFSCLIVIGVFSLLAFQALVNISMNLGLLPITGITLPLVSSGGSSILATMMALGLVNNISSYQTHKQPLEIK